MELPKIYHYIKASGLVDEECLGRVLEGVTSNDPAFLQVDPFLTDLSAMPLDRRHLQKTVSIAGVKKKVRAATETPTDESQTSLEATLDGETMSTELGGFGPLDRRLADELIRRGFLNRWQVRQFFSGRTKFTLGDYQIFDSLGHGGYGHVFLGQTEESGTSFYVAIKVLPLSKATDEMTQRFLHEIDVQKNLSHPNLVRFLGSGRDGNVHYMVHEFVNSGDLRELLRVEGSLSIAVAAPIMAQIVRVVHYLHERHIVHRDVKPANVLLNHRGVAKLADLGLAVSYDSLNEPQATSRVAGTVDYMSPDQILQPGVPMPAWDIYSLGCMLYQLLTGKVPFPHGDSQQKLRARLHSDAKDARILNQAVPFDLADLLRGMLTRNAEDRISAPEIVSRLLAWCGDDCVKDIHSL